MTSNKPGEKQKEKRANAGMDSNCGVHTSTSSAGTEAPSSHLSYQKIKKINATPSMTFSPFATSCNPIKYSFVRLSQMQRL